MPAILDRCVQKVMSKGHDKSSAFAICRTSLDLAADGSEDENEVTMQDEEMTKKIEHAMQNLANSLERGPMDQPVLRKRITVAHGGRGFKNGSTSFNFTDDDFDQLVANFKSLGNQVPVFLGFHVENGDQKARTPADGWVEGLERVGHDLVADVKLHGTAAAAVALDEYRGVSVGIRPDALDLKGKPIGLVLDHLSVLNDGFFGDLNIAARSMPTAATGMLCLVSRREESVMSKKAGVLLETEGQDPALDEVSDPKALALIKDRDGEILRLKAETINQQEQIDTLKAQIATTRKDPQLAAALTEIECLKRKDLARDIISLVDEGLYVRHNLKPAWTKGYKPERDQSGAPQDSLECAIQWLQASRFKGDIKLLRFQVENADPIAEIGKTYPSGKPVDTSTAPLSAEQAEIARKAGHDPEQIVKLRNVTTVEEFKRLNLGKKEGGK